MRLIIGWTLVIVTFAMAFYINFYFGVDSPYSMILFIPIILVGLWSYWRAVYVALLLGFTNVALSMTTFGAIPLTEFFRATMYVIVALAVGMLSEKKDMLLSKVKESEEKYRFIAASINDCIIATDLEGMLRYANPRACEVAGYSLDDYAGKPALSLVPVEEREALDRLFKSSISEGKPQQAEIEIAAKSGEKSTIELNAGALRDSEGRVSGVVAVFRDVTDRKRTQAALQRSRDFYLTLLESFPGLIWRTGPDNKGVYFNRNWLEFTGQPVEHETGEGWLAGVYGPDGDRRALAFREAFEARRAFECEFRLRRKDGAYRWLLEAGRPFYDIDGRFEGYIGFAYDITERKAAAEELQHKNRELRLLNSISSNINRSQDMPGMLYSALNDAIGLLGAEAGGIYLADNAGPGQMKLWASLPYVPAGTPGLFQPSFIPATRVDAGKVYAVDDLRSGCLSRANGGTIIMVPLTAKARLVGLMTLCAGVAEESRHPGEKESDTSPQLLSIGSQLGIAIENQQLFSKIRETSERLSDIIDGSPDAMLTTDTAGMVQLFNKSASRVLKYTPEEVVGRHLSTLLPEGSDIKVDPARSYVREFRCRDGTPISLNISAARLSRSDADDGYIITLKDLSEIAGLKIVPLSEKAADDDQAYHFSRGVIYLMDKGKTAGNMDIFVDQVKHSIQGLCITRQNPKLIRDRYGLEKTPVIWLHGGEATRGEMAIKPGNLSSLTATIAEFIAKAEDGVVMLDGMEYLLARNGFDALLKFVQYLNDRIMVSGSRAFFCIDASTLDAVQRHLLLTEMVEYNER